jgi:hypothetical protein
MMTEDRCVWMYAVADDAEPAFAGGLIGVGGGQVRPLAAAGLVAVVGDVPPSEFGEAELRRNLEDLEWLERTARAHHAVIEAVAKERTVVPMRLATVYRSDESAAGTLAERAADLREALARITGRSEWGVKAYLAAPAEAENPAAENPAAQGPAAEGPGPDDQAGRPLGPGAAYLRRRRAQLTARQEARAAALASARAVYEELGRLAVAARPYPLQAPEIAGHPASMVFNAAYLVADERADELAAAVTELAARHPSVKLTLTGPWPAYSFAAGDRQEDAAGDRP